MVFIFSIENRSKFCLCIPLPKPLKQLNFNQTQRDNTDNCQNKYSIIILDNIMFDS